MNTVNEEELTERYWIKAIIDKLGWKRLKRRG